MRARDEAELCVTLTGHCRVIVASDLQHFQGVAVAVLCSYSTNLLVVHETI